MFKMTGDYAKCGVYLIRNTVNGKVYVGSTSQAFYHRWKKHQSDLSKGRHHSNKLQRAWEKYGSEAFEFRIIEITLPEHAVAVEQTILDYYKSALPRTGYNVAPIAGSTRGVPRRKGAVFSDTHRANLSKSGVGRLLSDESRAKMSASQRAKKPASDIARKRISDAMKGRVFSDLHRQRLSTAGRGRVTTESSRRLMSESRRNNAQSRQIVIHGVEINATEAAERYGVNYYTMMARMYKGWSDHEAVFGRQK